MSATAVAVSAVSEERWNIALPRSVTFPNWPAVRSENAREALDAIFEAFGVKECWSGMEDTEDDVRRAILDHYGKTGHAPSLSQLADISGLETGDLSNLVNKLKGRDLLVLDEKGEAIIGSYPFTERDTGHRVHLNDVPLNAMCAIDALGAPAMYETDAVIESSCRECGKPVRVTTRRGGHELAEVSPSEAVVWSGIRYQDNCAADSLCTVIAFFCSDRHLEAWRAANHLDIMGFKLSMDEAMQAGKAIFMPMLADPSPQVTDVEGKDHE